VLGDQPHRVESRVQKRVVGMLAFELAECLTRERDIAALLACVVEGSCLE
jgi:hypothetical protein